MTSNWKVYCVDEGDWINTRQVSKPTQCPNNAGHSIRAISRRPVKGDLIIEVDDDDGRFAVGSDGQVLSVNSNTDFGIEWIDPSANTGIQIAHICDVKSIGTNGGTFTSGAWRQRDLNVINQTNSFASISNNELTLQSGTYSFQAFVPAYDTDSHQARIYNITDSQVETYGMLAFNDSRRPSMNVSYILHILTVSGGSKTYRLEHRCETSKNGNGFGLAAGWGDEVYTNIYIKKIAD